MFTGATSRFVGLKAKFGFIVCLLVSISCALNGWLAWHQLQQQQLRALSQQAKLTQSAFERLIERKIDAVSAFAKQHPPTLAQSDKGLIVTSRYFQLWQQQHDVTGMALFSSQRELSQQFGRPLLKPLPPFSNNLEVTVHCRQHCELQLVLPVTQAQSSLLVAMPLQTLLSEFGRAHRLQLAVLTEDGSLGAPLWGRALLAVAGSEFSPSLIDELKQVTEPTQLMQQPQLLTSGGTRLGVMAWPFDVSRQQLLLVQPLPFYDQSLRQLGYSLLAAWLVLITVSVILVRVGLGRNITRLQQLTSQLPLLGQRRFSELRQHLGGDSPALMDEVDQLEQVTKDVSAQLQRLEEDVERHTGELQRMAMFDELTGLPNRSMFLHELTNAVNSIGRTDKQIALLLIDLDDFNRTNDNLGQDVGDELLKTVAMRIQKSVRGMDMVCRLGGDEFVVIVRGLVSETDVHRVIHQIFSSLQQPLQLGRHTLIVTASIGVAFCDNPTLRAEELVKRADLAMYKAKRAGRCNYRIFNEQMLANASRREQLEKQIGDAIDSEQIVMVVQPVIDLKSGDMVGFEALCRWYRPNHGLVLPNQFVSELEGCKQSLALAETVITQSITLLAQLTKQMQRDDFFVSINLSPCQFLHLPLLSMIEQQLQLTQLDPTRLMIEVTEEALIRNLEQANEIMHRYKALGVKIAIDDFGTGYSSLNYLKKLPFDVLKVDKDLVAELDNSNVDRNIVTSVIDLAHSLERTVIAEGVENHDQRHFLQRCGCDYAQGYLYAAPMDQHQLQSNINKQHKADME